MVTYLLAHNESFHEISAFSGINNVVHPSLWYCELNPKPGGWNRLVISNEFIITLKQCPSSCCHWPAIAIHINELCLAFLRTCESWNPTTKSAFINTTKFNIFYHFWMFITESFSATRNSITARCLKSHITIPHHFGNPCAIERQHIVLHQCSSMQEIQNSSSSVWRNSPVWPLASHIILLQSCWFWVFTH